MDLYIFGPKIHLNSPKNCIFILKKGFEPQYFTLRTMEKIGNLSVKNILKISPKLRLSILINFVLIKKRVYTGEFIYCTHQTSLYCHTLVFIAPRYKVFYPVL